RQAHNLKAAGSNPAPATRKFQSPAKSLTWRGFLLRPTPHPYQTPHYFNDLVPVGSNRGA
ncbi:hypothetical protein, partial [Zymomonas mobilis]|uniref:hypothetical protein n=1 Tax=Zymomonas mobilis TaxID=542 RepID=UPI0039E82433